MRRYLVLESVQSRENLRHSIPEQNRIFNINTFWGTQCVIQNGGYVLRHVAYSVSQVTAIQVEMCLSIDTIITSNSSCAFTCMLHVSELFLGNHQACQTKFLKRKIK